MKHRPFDVWRAIQLGKMREHRTIIVPALEAALSDADEWVRVSVASALGQHSHPLAISILVEHLNATYLMTRQAAAEGLGAMGAAASQAVSELEKAMCQAGGAEDSIIEALMHIGTSEAKESVGRLQRQRIDSGLPAYTSEHREKPGWEAL